jgi:NADH-quinone oxidoreductase subunit M
MNSLLIILLAIFGGAFISFLLDKIMPVVRDIFNVVLLLFVAFTFYSNMSNTEVLNLYIGGIQLSWGFTAAGNLFAMIVVVLGLLAIIYSTSYMKGKERLGYFYFNFLLSIGSMLGILMSRDLISLFIFWEIMTWSSYFVVIYSGKDVDKRGLKYFVFSAIGAYAMLMGIIMAYSYIGSFMIDDVFLSFPALGYYRQLSIAILLMIGFGVKTAMMPLHVWAPDAYSESPMSFTAIFSGALSKMGVFGFALVMFNMLSPETQLVYDVIGWMGAITAVLATFYAVIQKDAKKLLAYSSIAQLGYIVVALSINTYLSVMAGLYMAVMHAMFKGSLFMAVGAVEKQAGTTDMTKISGLIRKMPWTFIAVLISIITLAGIPPLGGFIGKWMLYESLITSGHYFLVIMIFLSSTAAFLYSYRILFGLFLGQEEEETAHVKEAPITMLIPMLILAFLAVLAGAFPGYIFQPVQEAMVTFGFADNLPKLNWWEFSVLSNAWGDKVIVTNIWLSIIVVFLAGLAFITIKGWKNQRYVTTKDISSSGELIQPEDNMTFQQSFYRPIERAIWPLLKKQIDDYYNSFAKGLEALFEFARRIYMGNGQMYALYVIIFLVILLVGGSQFFGF